MRKKKEPAPVEPFTEPDWEARVPPFPSSEVLKQRIWNEKVNLAFWSVLTGFNFLYIFRNLDEGNGWVWFVINTAFALLALFFVFVAFRKLTDQVDNAIRTESLRVLYRLREKRNTPVKLVSVDDVALGLGVDPSELNDGDSR